MRVRQDPQARRRLRPPELFADPITPEPDRPAGLAHKDFALEQALTSIAGSRGWNIGERLSYRGGPDSLITAVERLPPADACVSPLPEDLPHILIEALAEKGITSLYTHQLQAISHIRQKRHVVITTPTASGKTLCYNLPVIEAILAEGSARALYLFPTKALAQDQLAELHSLVEATEAKGEAGEGSASVTRVGVYTYDGDTPQDARRAIRSRAHIVLSNPDMLHSGILPHHPRWAKLFENLRFVIIDELHAYRGVFGSHLANVLRRLQRICRHYGSDPVFVCCSATIANPKHLTERLIGRPVELISKSGAPRGEKLFVFLNPPVVNRQLGIRRSYLAETRKVALEFLRQSLQVIVFAPSRLATEILVTYLKDACTNLPGGEDVVRGYRGGYLPHRRREIERGLRRGQVRAVVSTNALELGIDIGALDVSVLASYPGTIAATWQRVGRAGRRTGRSAAVLVASSAPLDQFIIRNPDYFFGHSPEHALINPDNEQIFVNHLKCAVFELPLGDDEAFGTDGAPGEVLRMLDEEGLVHRAGSAWHWTSESYPADAVSLRSVSSDNFVVVDITGEPRVIGETDYTSGPAVLHEKAIYLLEGRLYQVERLDFEGRKAFVRETDCDYYTDAITYTKVRILETFEDHGCADQVAAIGAHGEVHVTSRVVGFKKIRFYTNENVGSGELELPEQQMHTTAYWLTIPATVMRALPHTTEDRRDGVLGLAFAARQVAQLLLMCDRRDIGLSIGQSNQSESWSALGSPPQSDGASAMAPDVSEPRIFIYDNYPGGIGLSEPLFRMHTELLSQTLRLISGCPCQSGCPSCVGPVGDTGPLAKIVAMGILRLIQMVRLKPDTTNKRT